MHACPPHAFFARDRPLRTGARLGGRRRRGFKAACALRGDFYTGFCAFKAVADRCAGAGAKAAAPVRARKAMIPFMLLMSSEVVV